MVLELWTTFFPYFLYFLDPIEKYYDATAKSPDQKFWMDCKKDKIGNFERGCSQSNHRKVTDFGLLQDFKRMIMTFVCYPLYLASFPLREWVVKNSSEQREKLAKTENFAMVE